MTHNRAEQVEQLAHEHGRMVFATAYRILGNAEDAEDAQQEVFLKMLRTWNRSLKSDAIRDWGAFLRVVASRAAVDLLRRNRRGKQNKEERSYAAGREELLALDRRNPRSEAIRHEQAKLLRQSLSALPKREACVFTLRYFEDFSYEQIAKHMGLSVSLVGVTLHRTRERLRKTLEPLVSPDSQQDSGKSNKESSHVTK